MEEETPSSEVDINRLMNPPCHQPSFTDLDLFISDSSGQDTTAPTPKKKLTFAPSELSKWMQESNSSSSSISSVETETTATSATTSTTDSNNDTLLISYLKGALTLSLQYEASLVSDDAKIKKSQEIIYELSAKISELNEQVAALNMDLSLAAFKIFVTQSMSEYFENSLLQTTEKIKFLTNELSSSIQLRATQNEEISLLKLELQKRNWDPQIKNYE